MKVTVVAKSEGMLHPRFINQRDKPTKLSFFTFFKQVNYNATTTTTTTATTMTTITATTTSIILCVHNMQSLVGLSFEGFVLALFDDDGAVWPATWDGLEKAIDVYYPGEIAMKMKPHWPTLSRSTWNDLEAVAGSFDALEEREGPMNLHSYLNADDTAVNARRFLANSLSVNRLFSGTGYTVDERNSQRKGTAEYFAANRLLTSIPAKQLVNVRL